MSILFMFSFCSIFLNRLYTVSTNLLLGGENNIRFCPLFSLCAGVEALPHSGDEKTKIRIEYNDKLDRNRRIVCECVSEV